jgi:glycosyltransferase involved in cell wall biosynthesis
MAGVVDSLSGYGLDCLIIDDGSHEPTRRALEEFGKRHSFVSVERLAENSGKGVALQTGYRRAHERGFTHVVQLDADGQHATVDVPRFLAAMEREPDALVLGVPIFDDSIPSSRLWARQISRGLVWLFTFSFTVRDPLCGYRGIPLAPTLELMDRLAFGERMEFDPELVVRLVWEGVPVAGVPTRVIYPPGGVSHFNILDDYGRLTRLYLRLAGGCVVRAPRLLARRLEGRS